MDRVQISSWRKCGIKSAWVLSLIGSRVDRKIGRHQQYWFIERSFILCTERWVIWRWRICRMVLNPKKWINNGKETHCTQQRSCRKCQRKTWWICCICQSEGKAEPFCSIDSGISFFSGHRQKARHVYHVTCIKNSLFSASVNLTVENQSPFRIRPGDEEGRAPQLAKRKAPMKDSNYREQCVASSDEQNEVLMRTQNQ